jgi:ATP-binding cassette subfamily B protein
MKKNTEKTKNNNKLFKRFINYYKPHRKLFIFDMFCSLTVAICNLIYPYIAKHIINISENISNIFPIIYWSLILLAIFISKMIFNFIVDYWGHIVGVRIQSDMRIEMFRHLEKLPFMYFDDNKTGAIMSRLTNDLFDIAELAHHAPETILTAGFTFIGAAVMLSLEYFWLGAIVFILMPLVILIIMVSRRGMIEAFRKMREETAELNAGIESAISGIRVTRAYNSTEHEVKKFNDENKSFIKARSHAYFHMSRFNSLMNFLMDFMYLVSIAVGCIFLFYGKIDSSQLTMYILYITTILSPIRRIIDIYEQITDGATGFKRFTEIIDTQPEIENENALDIGKAKGNIEYNNVTFGYKSTETPKMILM